MLKQANLNFTSDFRWLSPLGISVALFLIYGSFYVLLGVLTPVFQNMAGGQQATISTAAKDTALLGQPTPELLQTNPALLKLRTMLLNVIGGLMVSAGILVLAVAWFGLRQGWALVALALAGMAVLPSGGWYFGRLPRQVSA